ncbi:MAG: NADAR family protein [Rhizobiaceae bacterium]|nr:NADAR family protein [Rhizobiaceae bacterium]
MPETIKFYRVKDPYGCFSNFSPHPISIQMKWPTSEHYFQAMKFQDFEIHMRILQTQSPMEAAKVGRDRSLPLRQDWEDVKVDIMRQALQAKISQHADVRTALLSTGDATIVEHTKNDSYWADGGDGTGQNMLGKLLMEIRDFLNCDGPFDELAYAPVPPWEKYPEIPRGSIGWRMGYGEDYFLMWWVWLKGITKEGKSKYWENIEIPEDWQSWFEHVKDRLA